MRFGGERVFNVKQMHNAGGVPYFILNCFTIVFVSTYTRELKIIGFENVEK